MTAIRDEWVEKGARAAEIAFAARPRDTRSLGAIASIAARAAIESVADDIRAQALAPVVALVESPPARLTGYVSTDALLAALARADGLSS